MDNRKILLLGVAYTTFLLKSLSPSLGSRAEGDENRSDGRIPAGLIRTVEIALEKRVSKAELNWEKSTQTVVVHYRCQQHRYHAVDKVDRIAEESRTGFGPAIDGFELNLTWWPESRSWGASGGFGGVRPKNYSSEYVNSYKLMEESGYIDLRFNYGPRTDPSILRSAQAELEKMGNRVFKPFAVENWLATSRGLQREIAEVVSKEHPEAKWKDEQNDLVCVFHVMMFDVHAVNETGGVSVESHQETGPKRDGFIIRLSPSTVPFGRRSNPVYGRIDGPYWRQYFSTYNRGDHVLRLDILYGKKIDKKIVANIVDVVERNLGNPSRF